MVSTHPPPRSYRNRGRMPPPRQARLAELADLYAFADPAAAAAWAPQVLDVGFGYGESLVAAAVARPDLRTLGVEVHRPGLLAAYEALHAAAGAGSTGDVRVLHSNVTALLPALAPGSLLAVQAFYPDPWPKRRHEARRLFVPDVLARVVDLLGGGGTLHLVTDIDSYAAGIVAALDADPRVERLPGGLGLPPTRYATRALAAGRVPHDLAWRRP
jgi:tRNA (guanine-N7-)-methyltransferase